MPGAVIEDEERAVKTDKRYDGRHHLREQLPFSGMGGRIDEDNVVRAQIKDYYDRIAEKEGIEPSKIREHLVREATKDADAERRKFAERIGKIGRSTNKHSK